MNSFSYTISGTQNSDWSSVVTAQTTTGLPDYDQAFIIYPNPAKNVVIIQYVVNNEYFSGGIQVCDVYGKTVVEMRLIASLQTTHIDVSGLAAGLYFVRIATDRGLVTKPFVKR